MMIESIESIDLYLVLLINGYHFQFLDVIMWFFSGPFIIIPIATMVLWSIYTSYDLKQSIYILLGIMIAIGLADLSSVHLFKEVFMRYRPSHNLELLKQLHFHEFDDGQFYQGGLYGFVSSHASNYFALFTICWAIINQKWIKISLLTITLVILFSRVYLGVHYVSDVICGAVLGYIVAYVVLHFLILKQIKQT